MECDMPKAEEAWQKAIECQQLARNAPTPQQRQAFLKLRDSWLRIANRAKVVESALRSPDQAA
jgi:hypothetical protein